MLGGLVLGVKFTEFFPDGHRRMKGMHAFFSFNNNSVRVYGNSTVGSFINHICYCM